VANPGPKRSKLQRQLDQQAIAKLTLQGWSQIDIAQYLELNQSTVSRDLKVVQKQWKESAIRDFDLDRQQELQRLAMLEKEYWAGWERSQQGKETSLTEKIGTGRDESGNTTGRVKLATRTEQRIGEAAFLNGIQRVIDSRCKLLGLYPKEDSSASQVHLNDSQLSVISSLMKEHHDSSH
jgi:hypothetical protein